MRELLKATLKTGSGSMASLLLGMLTVKIMAVVLGPSGIGLYSLLRQIRDFSGSLGTAGGQIAVVQGLASRKGDSRDNYLVTTFWIFMVAVLLTSTALLTLAPWITPLVFDRDDPQSVGLVRWLALPVGLGILSAYFGGVLNGFRAIGRLALLQVLVSATAVLLSYPASRWVDQGYPLAFVGMMSVSQATGVAFGVWTATREGWLNPLLLKFRVRFHQDSIRHFFSIAGTMMFTGLAATGVVLAVRSLVVHHDGLFGAGIFDAAWTLSMTYVMLILASFGTYYLPTLSQTDDLSNRIALMRRVMRLSILLMVPLVTGVIVLKPLVVQIFYSSEFAPTLEIIRWMLIGDYLKVVAWVLAMPVLAYADMRVFLFTELLWNAGFLASAALALFGFGSMQGIGIGFLVMYGVYLAYYLHYVRVRHDFVLSRSMTASLLAGLIPIIGASLHTWTDTQVYWFPAILWLTAALAFSWLFLNRNERSSMLDLLLRRRDARA